MQIEAHNLGKRYKREWIFKALTVQFDVNTTTGIIGSNGSGKSTLLKILSAAELPSKGEVSYLEKGTKINHSEIYKYLSFAAPYMQLPEQLNAAEIYRFHAAFKNFQHQLSEEEFLQLIYLTDAKEKAIKNFSSGMIQRLKLGLAICSESALLILDEPCSNLDKRGVELYWKLLEEYGRNRTILIGSNEQEEELVDIDSYINLLNYK